MWQQLSKWLTSHRNGNRNRQIDETDETTRERESATADGVERRRGARQGWSGRRRRRGGGGHCGATDWAATDDWTRGQNVKMSSTCGVFIDGMPECWHAAKRRNGREIRNSRSSCSSFEVRRSPLNSAFQFEIEACRSFGACLELELHCSIF